MKTTFAAALLSLALLSVSGSPVEAATTPKVKAKATATQTRKAKSVVLR